MTCENVELQDKLGPYIAGKLTDTERDQFEEHFFHCEVCLQQVEAARLARDVLAAKPASKRWWLPVLAAAAVLILAVGVWKGLAPRQESVVMAPPKPLSPTVSYELLAKIEAPVYQPSTLRGAERSSRQFREAMNAYSAGNFAAAASALRVVDGVEASFYRAVSEVLAGDRAAGIADLRKVVAAGDTPFQSEARFYLGKSLIGAGDLAGARIELERLVREKSEWALQADNLLVQLPREIKPAQ